MREMKAEDCRNVLVVAITPRDAERKIDVEGIARNVRHLCDMGVDFIMPECGTGLVYDATLAEYEAVGINEILVPDFAFSTEDRNDNLDRFRAEVVNY